MMRKKLHKADMQVLTRKNGFSMHWDIMNRISSATKEVIVKRMFMNGMTLRTPVGQFIINQQVCLITLDFM